MADMFREGDSSRCNGCFWTMLSNAWDLVFFESADILSCSQVQSLGTCLDDVAKVIVLIRSSTFKNSTVE